MREINTEVCVMVKKYFKIHQAIALAVVLAMVAPVGVLAKDGKKHFKEGMKYEENRQWDKAAEQFALAVAEKPSNVEYQLHLQRSLVNAAIMLVERGDMLVGIEIARPAGHGREVKLGWLASFG